MAAAIADARAHGAVVVVAAGNESVDASLASPGNCPGAFTVAAVDRDGSQAGFSNYGPMVDIAAPGVGIWSTIDSGTTVPVGPTYFDYDGTSMAAPHVAAVAALVLSARPGLTPAEVETLIRGTATPFPRSAAAPCAVGRCGAGIANAAAAVAAITDASAPVGDFSFAGLAGAAPQAPDPSVRLSLVASDPQSGVAEVEISNDGTNWRRYPATTSVAWSLVDPAFGGSPDPGPRIVEVRWRNGAGLVSAAVTRAIEYIAAPRASLTPLEPWSRSRSLAVAWSATPRVGTAKVASFDVRYRRAPWNGGFGAWRAWQASTTTARSAFRGEPGSTYCFAVRATDDRNAVSSWSSTSCTATPLDDRALARRGGWSSLRSAAYYGGTYVVARKQGATLTRTGIVARRIAIMATTCPKCGAVSVRFGGTVVRRISLTSPTIQHRLVVVATFAAGRRGTLEIRVTSRLRPVIVDAILVGRAEAGADAAGATVGSDGSF